MLEFYEFNTFNIIIVLVITFIIYYIISNYLNSKETDLKKNKFNLEYLIVSFIISMCLSLIIAYIITSTTESILTDNYWDPIKDAQNVD